VTTLAGVATPGFKDGNADIAQFSPGNSIVADAQGNLYVADAGNNRIRKISVNGQVTTIAGPAPFASPGGIAIDKQGNLYVVDRGNFIIRKITPAGNVSPFAGSGTPGNKDGNAGEAQFSENVRDIVIDDQEIYTYQMAISSVKSISKALFRRLPEVLPVSVMALEPRQNSIFRVGWE
jgi:DNA-binding beta-propeller fold protein YncE